MSSITPSFRRIPITNRLKDTLPTFADVLEKIEKTHIVKLHSEHNMDEYGVQIMKYVLEIVTNSMKDVTMQHVNSMQMTFGNLPFILDTDMYYKYLWGTHDKNKNSQRPDGVFILELIDSTTGESESLLLLYECDGTAASKKGTFRKVAMKIRQGVDGSTKISEDMPAVSVRANFDMRQSLQDPFMSNEEEDESVVMVNSKQDNQDTYNFLHELCVAHLWTAYNTVLLLHKRGTMNLFCHNSDKDHLYDLNFFIGRFAIESSMSSMHRAGDNLGNNHKCDDKHKRHEVHKFLNSNNGFFENWQVLSKKYTVRVCDAADIKCIAIQRVNFEKFTNELKNKRISNLGTTGHTTHSTRGSTAKKANGTITKPSSSSEDLSESESDDSDHSSATVKSKKKPSIKKKSTQPKSMKILANEGMWTLLDIWKLISLCINSNDTISFDLFSNAKMEIPTGTTVKPIKGIDSIREYFGKDNVLNNSIVQPLMNEFENVMFDIVSSILWKGAPGDKSMKKKLDNMKIGILTKYTELRTRSTCDSLEDMHMVQEAGHTSKSKSLTSFCQISLHSTLPNIDKDMEKYVQRMRTPNLKLFLRMIRCVNLFALKELALRYETESIGSEFQRVLHTLPLGTQSEILYLFDKIKKDESVLLKTILPKQPPYSDTTTINVTTKDLRSIAYQIYREFNSDGEGLNFRHLLLQMVADIMAEDLKLTEMDTLWVPDKSVPIKKAIFKRPQEEYKELGIPFAWKVLMCEELIKSVLQTKCNTYFEDDDNEQIKTQLKKMLRIMMVNIKFEKKDQFKCGSYISSKTQWLKGDKIPENTMKDNIEVEWDLSVECDGDIWNPLTTESWESRYIEKKELENKSIFTPVQIVYNLEKVITQSEFNQLKIYIKSKSQHSEIQSLYMPVMGYYYVTIKNDDGTNQKWIPNRKFEVMKNSKDETDIEKVEFEGHYYTKDQTKICKILDTWPIRDVNHFIKCHKRTEIEVTLEDKSDKIKLKLNSNQLEGVEYSRMAPDELYAWAWMFDDIQSTHTTNQHMPTQLQMQTHWKLENAEKASSRYNIFLRDKITHDKKKDINNVCIWRWKRFLIKTIFMHAFKSINMEVANDCIDVLCQNIDPTDFMIISALQNIKVGLSREYLKNCDDYIYPRHSTAPHILSRRFTLSDMEIELPSLAFSTSNQTYQVKYENSVVDMTNHICITKNEEDKTKKGVRAQSKEIYDFTCTKVALRYNKSKPSTSTPAPYYLKAVLVKENKDSYIKWEDVQY